MSAAVGDKLSEARMQAQPSQPRVFPRFFTQSAPWMCLALGLAAFAFRLDLLPKRQYDPDEFEHVHSAWSYSKGLTPYRDFFEHHTPGLYFLLAPTFRWFAPEQSAESAIAYLTFARHIMWVLSGFILALTGILAWKMTNNGLLAMLAFMLLSFHIVFLSKSLEIRPDVLAALCWMASLLLLSMAVEQSNHYRIHWIGFFASGISLGIGVMCSQKLLLAGPGMAVFSVVFCFSGYKYRLFLKRSSAIGFQFIGFGIPILATWAYFSRQGAGSTFVENNFLLNMGWKSETSAIDTLKWLATRDPFFTALAIAGLITSLFEICSRNGLSYSRLAVWINTVGLIVGLFFIPVPYPQYCLLFLPATAIYAAGFLVRFTNSLSLSLAESYRRQQALSFLGLLGLFSGSLALLIPFADHLYFATQWFYPLLGMAAVVAGSLLVWRGNQGIALMTFSTPLLFFSAQQMNWMRGLDNSATLDRLRFVMENTKSDDLVLDGWSGLGTFRPHAWYYFFVHPGIQLAITPQQVDQFTSDLEKGVIKPALVIPGDMLFNLAPGLTDYLQKHYQQSNMPGIWSRLSDDRQSAIKSVD